MLLNATEGAYLACRFGGTIRHLTGGIPSGITEADNNSC